MPQASVVQLRSSEQTVLAEPTWSWSHPLRSEAAHRATRTRPGHLLYWGRSPSPPGGPRRPRENAKPRDGFLELRSRHARTESLGLIRLGRVLLQAKSDPSRFIDSRRPQICAAQIGSKHQISFCLPGW